MKLLATAILLASSMGFAQALVKEKIPAQHNSKLNQYVLDNLCYNNVNYPAFQNCQNDKRTLDLLSNADVQINSSCQYVSVCGQWTNTYILQSNIIVR